MLPIPPSGSRLASISKSPPFCDGVRGEALQVHVLHRAVREGWAPVSSEGHGSRPDSADGTKCACAARHPAGATAGTGWGHCGGRGLSPRPTALLRGKRGVPALGGLRSLPAITAAAVLRPCPCTQHWAPSAALPAGQGTGPCPAFPYLFRG